MSNTIKTFRRDRLLRMAQQGKLVVVDSYSYDDMTGSVRNKTERPVKIVEPGDSRPEGTVCLFPSDFNGSGRAYQYVEDGRIVLHIHGNLNVTFRIKE